jgi:hypothetical protein
MPVTIYVLRPICLNADVDDKDFRNPAELTKQLREKLPRRLKRVTRHLSSVRKLCQFSIAIGASFGEGRRPSSKKANLLKPKDR